MKHVYALMFIVILTSSVLAQIPRTLSYQGVLTDLSGNPKADGSYNISFSLYEQSTGGTAIWTEAKSLALTKGLFSTALGDLTPFADSIKFKQQYWLGITVGTDPELTPRIILNANGYSFSSIYSDTAGNIINGKVVKNLNGLKDNITIQGAGGTTINSNGNVITVSSSGTGGTGIQGIQSSNNTLDITNPNGPTATVNLKNPLTLSGPVSSPNYIISGTATGTGNGISGISVSGIGVAGIATGTSNANYGVVGNSLSPSGFAVTGYNAAATGDAVGVNGQTNSPAGIGVLGNVSGGTGIKGTSTSGRGVWGSSSSWQGVYGFSQSQAGTVGESNGFDGVYGICNDGTHAGVSGHNSTTGFGVWGSSTSGIGVKGISGSGTAVQGISTSFDGIQGNSTSGVGLHGNSASGIGVYGVTGGTYSVVGENSNAGKSLGVLGYHGTTGNSNFFDASVMGYAGLDNSIAVYGWVGYGVFSYAGLFDGNVVVNGITYSTDIYVSGTKNFKIDHPQDPGNKYLIHSCIESPDRMNIYNGNITTDAAGLATVNLPSYFEALNIDYRYQLTVMGQFAQAIIDKKIQNNSFVIRTDKPNVEVSWQVTGIRNDPYAKAHPMVVEQVKNEREKGKYYFPELYGQPKNKSLYNVADGKPEQIK
jgi:hypothetical protein